MVRIISALVLGALVSATPALPASAQEGKVVSAVVLPDEASAPARVVDAFHAALKANDTATALAQLADSALIFEGGYVERSKMEYASHHASADAAYASAVPSSLSSRTGGVSDSLAWIASESRATGAYKGKAVDRLTTETMLLKREGDRWLIVHIHWSSRPAG